MHGFGTIAGTSGTDYNMSGWEKRAELAIETLMELKDGKNQGETVVLPVFQIERESVRCLSDK